MSDDEIKEFMKDNKENNYQLGISATLTAIITVLIKNNITTVEEFKKIVEYSLEKVRDEQINRMSAEEKQQLESLKRFNDLFGMFFNRKDKNDDK